MSTCAAASMVPDRSAPQPSGTAGGDGAGIRHSTFTLYEPVVPRFLALTRRTYVPVAANRKGLYPLALRDALPISSGLKSVSSALALLPGVAENPPLLASATEMVRPACPANE